MNNELSKKSVFIVADTKEKYKSICRCMLWHNEKGITLHGMDTIWVNPTAVMNVIDKARGVRNGMLIFINPLSGLNENDSELLSGLADICRLNGMYVFNIYNTSEY